MIIMQCRKLHVTDYKAYCVLTLANLIHNIHTVGVKIHVNRPIRLSIFRQLWLKSTSLQCLGN